ncbi:MAG: cytochrome c biogenesis protein ResB [Nitrospirae bacterium]|nr:cytochrome c biogenesis protein ResB [Nitrospirota bacterium]
MIRHIKRFFLSRKTILALILLILGAVVLAYIFPQRFITAPPEMEKWQEAHPFWIPWVERFGLDHVYSTPWFALLLCLFMLSLSISTYEQIRITMKKTFGIGIQSEGKDLKIAAPQEKLIAAIKKQGYLRTAENPDLIRFVKHPWGYWGNVLLHLGILVAIASSLVIVLTQKRGLLNLIEGEVYLPGSPWLVEENGIFANNFILPEAVRLDSVIPEFWETEDLKQLTTVISFVDTEGRFRRYTLAINQTVNYRGIRAYQKNIFGSAFFVEVIDREGRKNGVILQMQSPPGRDKASYENFRLEGVPYLLKAKYFADADKKSITSANPLLILRLVDKERVIGEIPLKIGESGQLGLYSVKLVNVSRWAGIIFVDITGMPGIFLGFFIIILGGGLTYFMPPREVYLRSEDGGFYVTWKATRFEDFYKEEYERVITQIQR